MTKITNVQGKLVIVNVCWKMGSIFVGAAFFLFYKVIVGDPQASGENFTGMMISTLLSMTAGLFFLWRWTFTFDRGCHVLTWKKIRPTGIKTGKIDFSDIKSVNLQSISSSGNLTLTYRMTIYLKDGSEFPLSPAYQKRREEYEQIIHQIQKYLSMEATTSEEINTTSVQAMVDSGNIINAIMMLRETEGISLTEAKQRVKEMQEKK